MEARVTRQDAEELLALMRQQLAHEPPRIEEERLVRAYLTVRSEARGADVNDGPETQHRVPARGARGFFDWED